jgi:hypothetical protein
MGRPVRRCRVNLTDRFESSRLWLLGRLLIPGPARARACIARGTHHPELADVGRIKVCNGCGTVNR